jgi:hypothetical protein
MKNEQKICEECFHKNVCVKTFNDEEIKECIHYSEQTFVLCFKDFTVPNIFGTDARIQEIKEKINKAYNIDFSIPECDDAYNMFINKLTEE